jgi:hypothetical protein
MSRAHRVNHLHGFTLACVIAVTFSSAWTGPRTGQSFAAHVVGVGDGDTIIILQPSTMATAAVACPSDPPASTTAARTARLNSESPAAATGRHPSAAWSSLMAPCHSSRVLGRLRQSHSGSRRRRARSGSRWRPVPRNDAPNGSRIGRTSPTNQPSPEARRTLLQASSD